MHLPGWMGSWPGGGGGGNFDAAPSTSSSSPSLSLLKIRDCPSLTSLGGGLLQHPLGTLKELKISACEELTSLPDRPLFRHLASLESLTMTDCPNLSWPPSATEGDALPPSLKQVEIHGCGDLMAELLLASLRELTSLSRLAMDVGSPESWAAGVGQLTSLRSLGIVGNNHVDDGALSTCLGGGLTTSLKSLSISNCSAVTVALPSEVEEALSRHSALQKLEISNCMELRSLGFSSQSLLSIEEIRIANCPKLLHLANEDAAATSPSSPTATSSSAPPQMLTTAKTLWIRASSPEQIAIWLRQCPSLQTLVIEECPQLIACFDDDGGGDDVIHLAPSLRRLMITLCENLRSLPSSLRGLSSLEHLAISLCPKIQRLPPAGLPEALEGLFIGGCPELADRCRKEGCPDWPLISHIPRVEVEDW